MFGLCPIGNGSQFDLRRDTSAEIALCVYAFGSQASGLRER